MEHVNVILAAYNGSKYIKEQIVSIMEGDYKELTLWIFDDGSTDNTEAIVKDCMLSYPDRIYYRKNEKNKGLTKNFLEGVLTVYEFKKNEDVLTHGKQYYMFSDQDDVWHKDKVSKTLDMMKYKEKANGELPTVCFTDALVVDENLNKIEDSFHWSNKLDVSKTDLPHLLMENKLIGCTIMFNEALVKRMEGSIGEGIRYHDWWIGLIASAFGSIGYVEDATISYRQHGGNMVGNQSFRNYVLKRFSKRKEQKETIHKNINQAKLFLAVYGKELGVREKEIIQAFIQISTQSWLKRRITILKYGFLKTGLIRNIGLLLLV